MAIDPEVVGRVLCTNPQNKLVVNQPYIQSTDPTGVIEFESLEDLAREIELHEQQSGEHVIKAAVLVAEAHKRVKDGEAGKVGWSDWAEEHIRLSSSRLAELLRIGQADDPKSELEMVRDQTRGRVQKHRAAQAAQKSAMEPERKELITWAKTAPIVAVQRVLEVATDPLA